MTLTRHIPNAITSMNLLSGVMGVICTMGGEPGLAFLCMIAGAVFDFGDGLAARLLGAYSPIGKELDSLADMVTFGVLPSLMLFQAQPAGANMIFRFLPLFIAIMSALRLAKFNVDTRQELDFIGLPTPACAMICGSLSCYLSFNGGVPEGAAPALLALLAVVLGLLLVSEIPMFGMKIKKGHRLLDTKRVVFLALSAAAVLLTVLLKGHWSLAVLLIFSAYVAENLVLALINSLRGAA